MFFADAQNKLIYAITQKTAAELIVSRADAMSPNMGLTSWKGSIVRKGDITIAKNYLLRDEIEDLNRLVDIFLTSAELRVKSRQDITLQYWKDNLDNLIQFQDKPVLKDRGHITSAQMETKINEIYKAFDARRKKNEAIEADREDVLFNDITELEALLP